MVVSEEKSKSEIVLQKLCCEVCASSVVVGARVSAACVFFQIFTRTHVLGFAPSSGAYRSYAQKGFVSHRRMVGKEEDP